MSGLKVLDLFSGLEGWSEPFRRAGHDVLSLDNDPKFSPDILADFLEFDFNDLPWMPDIICASPPCEKFSTMAFSSGYFKMHGSKRDGTAFYTAERPEAELAMALVERTVKWIENIRPRFFIIENPRALLRRLDIIPYERRTVTYCQYWTPGEGPKRMKPTDIWGGFPESFKTNAPCKNGAPCHVPAPRGSRTGTQGMDRAMSAKIPFKLADSFRIACEQDYT